ncbi:MAG: tetratricopeptide repeat protein [Desulfobulbales bacterium]|nr:tetratricopeptide repeat protein [Desulfobulbales bacterium]
MRDQAKPTSLERLGGARPYIPLFLVLLLVGLVYGNTLNSPPVLDDRAAFINNPSVYIDGFSHQSLSRVYTGRFGRTRFIPMLTFAVDHLLGRGDIIRFHLTNIIIHLLATTALFFLVHGLAMTGTGRKHLYSFSPPLFALFVTALWALHPVQTNAVTYLVQRMASLVALFYFAALAAYLWARIAPSRPRRVMAWTFLPFAMLGAFLSKENSATLPLAILLVETIFISPNLGRRVLKGIRRHYRSILAIILLLLLPLAAAKLTSFSSGYAGRHFDMTERLFTEWRVVVFYLSLLALPLPGRLNLDHDFPVSQSLLDPSATWLSLLLLGFLILAAFRLRRAHPFISFGLFFFFLNLIIESSVVPLELVFEHRLYLPSPGFFLIIVALIDWGSRFIQAGDHRERQTIAILAMVIIGCSLAVTTSFRNHVWRDKLTLYEDIARKSPLKPRAHTNLGMELAKAERYEEALATLRQAIYLGSGQSEEYVKAANNIVTIFVSQQRFEEAVKWAEKLIKNRPPDRLNFDGFPMLMANLGISYWKLAKYRDSLEAFRIGIRVRHPRHTPLLLGGMEAMLLDAAASEEGRRQLGLGQEAESIYNEMATALLLDKDYDNARTYLNKSLTIAPGNDPALAIEKIIADETGRNQLAREMIASTMKPVVSTGLPFRLTLYAADFIKKWHIPDHLTDLLLEKAVQLEPESIHAALKLSGFKLQNGNIDDALKIIERHLQGKPSSPPLLELAGKCYFARGNNRKAAEMLSRLLEIYPGHPEWKRYSRFIRTYY